MNAARRCRFSIILLTLLSVAACGSSGKEEASINESLPPPIHSKEIGLQCLSQGDLGCASENFCALSSDAHAALRCCVSQFLESYFSDNTQALGRMLGYAPASFAEIRGMSREEMLQAKALPFGEFFLQDQASAPKPKDLVIAWGGALIRDQASTEELAQRVSKFGEDLEVASACFGKVSSTFSSDEIEKEVFSTQAGLKVNERDLKFLESFGGLLAYSLQFGGAYQAGVAQFPKLPLSQDFLKDLNGHVGEGDARIGDLEASEAQGIVANFPLLQRSFAALKAFSELKDQPGRIDAYLNWRFSEGTQKDVSTVLKAAYLSLTQATWTPISDWNWELNLNALAKVEELPNGQGLDRQSDFLSRDGASEIQINEVLLKQWASPLLREALP